MSLGEEDLGVLMKILVENIGEGSKTHSVDAKTQVAQGNQVHDGKSHYRQVVYKTSQMNQLH